MPNNAEHDPLQPGSARRVFAPEHVITARELRRYMARSNHAAIRRFVCILAVIAVTGFTVAKTAGTLWCIPAMAVHGFILVHLFSLQHETTHGTAFKSRFLNHSISWVCGIAINLGPKFFQYEHVQHHTWTQYPPEDPQHIPLPSTLGGYFWYLTALPYWHSQFRALFLHAGGVISENEKRFLPEAVRPGIILEARIILGIYATVAILAFANGWTWPLYLWILPLLLGEPAMRFIRMTEHVGMPLSPDLSRNTRTNHVPWPLQMLCWNMNFHAEHHFSPLVPFHALPALNRQIGNDLPETRGYIAAHRQILRSLRTRD